MQFNDVVHACFHFRLSFICLLFNASSLNKPNWTFSFQYIGGSFHKSVPCIHSSYFLLCYSLLIAKPWIGFNSTGALIGGGSDT